MPNAVARGARSVRTGAVAAAAAATAVAAALLLLRSPRETLPTYGAAPAFALTDQLGRTVRSDDLRGRVLVASFVYTACPDVCSTITARMARLQARLAADGRLAGVRLLSITVDPRRDTPEVLRGYAERHGADPEAWRFLTGPEASVRSLVTDGFKLALLPAAKAAAADHGGPGGAHAAAPEAAVLHTSRLVLVDRSGRVRGYYDGPDLDVDRVLRDVEGLLR